MQREKKSYQMLIEKKYRMLHIYLYFIIFINIKTYNLSYNDYITCVVHLKLIAQFSCKSQDKSFKHN